MKRYTFICGGAGASCSDQVSADHIQRLAVSGPERNVNLRLTDVSRALVSNLPDLLLDLLELAAYVFCGDQRARRGTEKLSGAGRDWRRHLKFVVPVRRLDVWASAAVRELLEEELGYLSDDFYEFEFVESIEPPAKGQIYFDGLNDDSGFEPDKVVLFSGGIDSLTGAVDDLCRGKRIVLIGHHSAPKVVNVQRQLVQALRKSGFSRQLFHVTVNVTNVDISPVEPTQRTRSFLFASLAFVIGQIFNRDGFTFYENGVISLNLPIAADLLGARATRTTHPKVIRGFEQIFTQLVGRQIAVETPYLWLTKKEVIDRLVEHGYGALLADSVSCVHPIGWTTSVRHCGTCSQCIDRGFAVLAAGAERHDVQAGYGVDLLLGDRLHNPLDPALAYVKFARKIAKLHPGQFQSEFPRASSSLHFAGGPASDVLDRIWDLHRRHAAGVLDVLARATREFADDLVHGKLATGSLLNLCFSRDRVESVGNDTAAQTAAFMDRLSAAVCEFAIDEATESIRFRGGYAIYGANYRLVHALVDRHRVAKRGNQLVPFYRMADLADNLELDDVALRKQIGRLRRAVEPKLAVDLGVVLPNGFIENKKSEGYRLSPELREVALADLEPPCHK